MKNLLVIEKHNKTIDEIVEALDSPDYFIHIADSSEKGYELALRNFPHLVICNNEIFNSSGENLSKLRDKFYLATIPFIFLLDSEKKSGKTSPKINFGFDFYIKKPFSREELQRMVKLAFDKFDVVAKKTQKQLEELRGSISYSLPHEFFTPLNGILGFSDILIKDFEHLTKDEIIEMLQFIKKDAARLKNLTENFIAFAELELIGKDPIKVDSLKKSYFINPKDIISSSAMEIAKENNRKDDLVLELDDAAIRISEGYLRKVLSEIINNAFKFSKEGSPVVVSLLSNDTSAMISISDNGRGMSSDQIGAIGAYMQFNRRTHEQQGSGLGLAIAKRIVELYGGEMTVESHPDEGSKFNLIFENKM